MPNLTTIEAHARQEEVAFRAARRVVQPIPGCTSSSNPKLRTSPPTSGTQYETIKRFALLDRDFTFDSGELTYTLKLKQRASVRSSTQISSRASTPKPPCHPFLPSAALLYFGEEYSCPRAVYFKLFPKLLPWRTRHSRRAFVKRQPMRSRMPPAQRSARWRSQFEKRQQNSFVDRMANSPVRPEARIQFVRPSFSVTAMALQFPPRLRRAQTAKQKGLPASP